jgi:hypothetical protein
MTQPRPLTESDLAQFTGSQMYYQNPFGIRYTEGVQYMAEHGGAYWLIDAIASWQRNPKVRNDRMLQEIQFWKLTAHEDQSATLICEREQGDVAIEQYIPFTDFPLAEIRLCCQQGVLLLPSEY